MDRVGIKMNKGSPKGIVLILLSGVVTIMLFLALLLLQMSRTWGRSAEAGLASAQACLAAASGMDYAASRLSEVGYPSPSRTVLDRGEDWRSRDPLGTPLEEARNPSFSHGEPWADAGAPAAYDGEAAFADRDSSGRFDAWSGRLRGPLGGGGDRFSLAVESSEGRIPLNAGVDAYRQGVEHVLNNLGAVLIAEGGTRRANLPSGDDAGGNPGHLFHLSWLGEWLMGNRPARGYASLQEVERTLVAGGYSPGERASILPRLDLGPYEASAESQRGSDPSAYAPICLATASREILVSLWRYLKADFAAAAAPGDPWDLAWHPGDLNGWRIPYFRTGPPAAPLTLKYANEPARPHTAMSVGGSHILYPEEVERIVDRFEALRAAGTVSWTSIRDRLMTDAPLIFAEEFAALAAWPANQGTWVRGKADLAFQAAAMNPLFATLSGDGLIDFTRIRRVYHPPWPSPSWGSDPFVPYRYYEWGWGCGLVPQGLTLAPPVLFEVRSLGEGPGGRKSTLAGRLRAAQRLDWFSQESFEGLSGGAGWAARGLRAVESPGPAVRHDLRAADPLPDGSLPLAADGSLRSQIHIATLPDRNWRSDGGSAQFSRVSGAVALAGREPGLCGGRLYWPFSEDFDLDPANDGLPEKDPPYVLSATDHRIGKKDYYMGWRGFNRTDLFLPGLTGVRTEKAEATIEGWIVPGGEFAIVPNLDTLFPLSLKAIRNPDPLVRGVRFELKTGWWPGTDYTLSRDFPDSALPGGRAVRARHFAITIRNYLRPTGLPGATSSWRTEYRLFIDGRDHPSGPMTLQTGYTPKRSFQQLWTKWVDEIWFLDRAVDPRPPTILGPPQRWDLSVPPPPPLEAAERHRHGYYVPRGVFASPLYAMEGPARFGLSQWSGLLPPGFPTGSVRAEWAGYGTPDGSGPETALGLGLPGAVEDLSGISGIRSFRYRVACDASAAGDPIVDTPVFESIWLTMRGNGRTPAWTAWESR